MGLLSPFGKMSTSFWWSRQREVEKGAIMAVDVFALSVEVTAKAVSALLCETSQEEDTQ